MDMDTLMMSLFLAGIDRDKYAPWLDKIRETGNIDATYQIRTLLEKLTQDIDIQTERIIYLRDVYELYFRLGTILIRAGADATIHIPATNAQNVYGYTTIAHIMAKFGYIFTDPEILKLKDMDGTTVEDFVDYASSVIRR